MTSRYHPRAMRLPPALDPSVPRRPPDARCALLVNPFYAKDPRCSFGKHVLTPSLALTSIAAATPPGWRVSLWDENLLQGAPPAVPPPQVVGITVHLTFAERAYELSRWFRRLGSSVVLGGPHVESCPDEASNHADAIVTGDGVAAWPSVLQDVEKGGLRPRYRGSFRQPLGDQPAPRRDLLPRECFLTTTSLMATRGCHNRCDFCTLATESLRVPYQRRPPEQIVEQWLADDEPYAVFIDNNLGSDRSYLRRLCHALAPLQRIWSAAVSLDVTDDPSLIRTMALAGCTGVFVGLESLSDANLRDAGKRTPPTADYGARVQRFHDVGIQVNASFVLGFDHDRPDLFDRTIDFVEAERIECATFQILTPYPGTPLFRRLEAQGRLLHRDWRLYDTAHVVFRPRHMSPGELSGGYAHCYERLFSHRSIWRRRPHPWQAVLPYLGMAYLYKRSNWLWHALIRRRVTHAAWRPLVELSRRRHLRHRQDLTRVHSVESSEYIFAPPGGDGADRGVAPAAGEPGVTASARAPGRGPARRRDRRGPSLPRPADRATARHRARPA